MSAVNLSIMQAGYCTQPEHIVLPDRSWKHVPFPAMFALIEHPRFGPMLFDTGYSPRFFEQTSRYPNKLYAQITPVYLKESELAVCQLAERGISPQDIGRIFISHFHADHIAALGDFTNANYVYLPHAFDAVRSLRGLPALSRAYLPGLIPPDFMSRSAPIDLAQPRALPPEYAPFAQGYDLLGDESVIAVELPGHATGQMGLFIRASDGEPYFLVADACWRSRSYQENIAPHRITNLLFSDPKAYRATLSHLHEFHGAHPHVHVIPSHCAETLARYTHG
jgi:glyoxylase-like metal-dependent hydrolase (beta-lactamase superfamily II)